MDGSQMDHGCFGLDVTGIAYVISYVSQFWLRMDGVRGVRSSEWGSGV